MPTEIRTRTITYTVEVQHAATATTDAYTTTETRFRQETYLVEIPDLAAPPSQDVIPPDAILMRTEDFEDDGDGVLDADDTLLASVDYEEGAIVAGADGAFTDDAPLVTASNETLNTIVATSPSTTTTTYDFDLIGADAPLSRAELEAEIEVWNADYASGVVPTDPANVYGTLYVPGEVYATFGDYHFVDPNSGAYVGRDAVLAATGLPATATTEDILAEGYVSDTFENYIQRHVDATNQIIEDGNARIDELVDEYGLDPADYPHIGEFELRRVVIVDAAAGSPNVALTPDDSYGDYTLNVNYAEWSSSAMAVNDATQLAEGVVRTDLEEGLMHEWGHQYFLMPDGYALSTVGEPIASDPVLADVPPALREFWMYPPQLMTNNTLTFSDYTLLRLSSDIATFGTIDTRAEDYRYPEGQLPEQFAIVLPPDVASIDIYRTTHPDANNYAQNLDTSFSFHVDDPAAGDFIIDQPFLLGWTDGAGVPNAGDSQGLIGVKLTMDDGSVQFRWIDTQAVITGSLLGFETPRLEFEWGTDSTDPFDEAYRGVEYSDAS